MTASDRPVLLIHARADIDDGWHQAHVDAAIAAYPGMDVSAIRGPNAPEGLEGRDVVIWPWMGQAQQVASLRAVAGVLARSAKRVRIIAPPQGERLGPADLNGHDPVAWARQYSIDIDPLPEFDLNQEWFGGIAPRESTAEPIELTHERITDPEIERPPLVSDFIADEARPRFKFHAALELVGTPTPTDWLLHGWFERNTLACYFGDPGSCKTWIALSQAVHIAIGVPWHGARVRQGAVFVLCGEGQRGFRRRLEGIRAYHEMSFEHVPLYVSDGPANLTDPDNVTDVLVSVQNLVEQSGSEPVLVVVDTLSRNFGAADENSTPDMAAFIGACDRIRQQYAATVLVIHHSGHGDKTRGRGNSALRAALDAEFKFHRDDAGEIEATCTKAKDFEMPPARRFGLVNVPLDWPPGDDGLPVNSAAVRAIESTAEPPARDRDRQPQGQNQTQALAKLTELVAVRRKVLEGEGRDPAGARVNLAEWQEATGLDRRRFYEVRKGLEKAGILNSDGYWVHINES